MELDLPFQAGATGSDARVRRGASWLDVLLEAKGLVEKPRQDDVVSGQGGAAICSP